MFKKILLLLFITLTVNTLVFSQNGTLKGKIFDKKTKEAIPFTNIIIELGGKQMGGTTSDFDGNYTIKPIPVGKYDVKASYIGYKPLLVRNVIVNIDKITFLNLEMSSTATNLDAVEVVDYKVPLISKDQTQSGGTMTSEEIEKMPGRSATSVAITVGGVFSQDGERGSIRGSRSEGTVTYIDGVRVRGSSSIPKSAIDQVTVVTGGLPAQYGDATGGIINITSKGPSRKFGVGAEIVSSELFDHYGYNLLGFNIQGPLIMGKDSTKATSLLGFFLSGEVISIADPNPFSIDQYTVKDDVLENLEKYPLRPSGTGFGSFQNSEFITDNDLIKIKQKQNTLTRGINLSGKIDVRTTPNTNLTFGGSLDYNNGNSYMYSYSMFNSKNNPQVIDNTWRVYGRFTQRFPTTKENKSSLIQNVFYSIQADYSNYHQTVQDPEHKDDLFKYGYVGKFKTYKVNSYELGSDTTLGYDNVWIHNGFMDTLYSFESSDVNPNLSNYTSQYYEHSDYYMNSTIVQFGGGLLNGEQPNSVYGIWSNTGTLYNGSSKSLSGGFSGGYSIGNYTQMSVNTNGSADIGNHAIQFGIQYEQRSDRYYGCRPVGLWTLMRQLINRHIEQLDKLNPLAVYDANGVFQDTVNYNRLYSPGEQAFFDYNLRNSLGLPVDGLDWIDVDNYDPETFSIDMFSPDELLNDGYSYINYYGYDHTGKVLANKPSFDDFFTAKDEHGNYKREIGAFEPIYSAGYIQDKFAFKDLIFNIGLRVDRFDANQKVLKDPFLLYNAKTVKEVGNLGDHPANMGQDYVVYVNNIENPSSILGYRDGATWYNDQGTEIQDPSILETSSGIAPYLVDPDQKQIDARSFKDYEPQVSYMPRISFSFPISDEALFFAHYDVLTKRPTTAARLDITDYLFMQNVNVLVNNPNLKPEKTVDYEFGFQQKLNNKSALKISLYYRELRDLVQAYKFNEAYPKSYISFNNIDFGTVKGMTVSYDLRRSNNIWIKANYTLQFADGTGSTATSGLSLVKSDQPNLRVTNPLSYDRRHAISTVFDYRFSTGKDYNGPKITKRIKNTDKVKTILLLENTGINITFTGGSGIPYTRNSIIGFAGGSSLVKGSINGSRLPWQFRMDARIDKVFSVKLNKNSKKQTDFNIYLQILNVLNTQNVMSVYSATGNPDDDGYLSAAEFQNTINSQVSTEAFIAQYQLYINSPYNYSLPRRIRLGIALNF